MKRLLVAITVIVLAFSLSACGEKAPSSSAKSSDPSGASQVQSTVGDTTPAASKPESKTKFEQFEAGLEDAGISYEKQTVAADMVGASIGARYVIGDGRAELYQFDPESDAYKQMKESKSLTLEGFGAFPVEVNEEMALLLNSFSSDAQSKVLEIFKNIA